MVSPNMASITQWMGEDVGQFGLSSPPDWHRLAPAGQLRLIHRCKIFLFILSFKSWISNHLPQHEHVLSQNHSLRLARARPSWPTNVLHIIFKTTISLLSYHMLISSNLSMKDPARPPEWHRLAPALHTNICIFDNSFSNFIFLILFLSDPGPIIVYPCH